MPTPQICPPTAISSFPLTLGFGPITSERYDSVSEPLTMDFQWASRSTPPLFTTPKSSAITDEVGSGNTNISTLRFMNNNYSIASVQIIRSWIGIPSAQFEIAGIILESFAAYGGING